MSFLTGAVTLLLVMDPFGNIPVFLSLLERVEPRKRKLVILREMLFAFIILTVFLFFGRLILQGLGLSEPALEIAGGTVLFIIALRLIFPSRRAYDDDPAAADPFIVPLAVPLIAGPSAMATVVLLSISSPGRIWTWFGALAAACGLATVVLLLAEVLRSVLGTRALAALERLTGMILTVIAVQMLLSGIREYVASL